MTYEHELEINAFGSWLLEQGKISQADLSAWFARTEREKAGQASIRKMSAGESNEQGNS